MYRKSFFLVGILCCVSCTLGPDFTSPELYSDAVIQNELSLKKEGKLPQNWYKNLADEYLQKLIVTGLNNNSDIAIAQAKLKQARLAAKINQTDFFPQISAKGGYNYQNGSENVKYSENAHYYSAGFDSSWEFDLWGKGRRQTEADEAYIKASEYGLSNLKTVIAAEIAADYINLQENIRHLRLARRNAELQKQIADVIKSEYHSGLGDETAYNQAQYLLNTTLSLIPQYESNIENYKNALSVLTGILPSQLTVPENTVLLGKMDYSLANTMKELPASVIRLRPDVAVAEYKLKAQNALIGKAVAELYPNVNISGLLGYSAQSGRKLFSSNSEVYNYAPAVYLPLLDWNKLKNNIELQKQEREIALEDYKQTVLKALSELKNAFSEYQSSVIAYRNKLKAQNNMQRVVDLTLKKYQNGMVKFSEVLDSEQNLTKAQEDTITARAQITKNVIAYYKSSGATIDN
ncbi:MAG: TolC family protein [Alphaproteobacteria bacterium]|nr:TolC family protein [Alphaproteobacteria bacterium]